MPNNSTVSTTEQDGKVIENEITVRYICGFFENKESDLPNFGPSTEEFLFETSDEDELKVCDKQCTKWCKENKK